MDAKGGIPKRTTRSRKLTIKTVDLLDLTAVELQNLLNDGLVTSRGIVQQYLEQIEKHNHQGLKLHAIISVQNHADLFQRAQQLDDERKRGKVRGPLHGVPIILKDICTTRNMPSTCGSYAFNGGNAKIDAPLIDTLNDAGLIIIAKANLSELGNAKGEGLMSGWSAVGGQGPAGSSSGSATAVAAGFAPVSLGTELQGSITWPAARAGLYAIKLSPGSVDQTGFQPGAVGFDCQGPYGKTVTDIATLSAVMQLHEPGHYHPLATSWEGLRVGVVDPKSWRIGPEVVETICGFLDQTDSALYEAETKIEELGAKLVKRIPLMSWDDIERAMPDVKQMEDLFSDDNQKALEDMRDCKMSEEIYQRNSKALRVAARSAVKQALQDGGVDVILGPCDSRLDSVASAAGYPLGNLPLGYADFNGRGFSLHAMAPVGEEGKIFQVMSAWEATFPENRRAPRKMLRDETVPSSVRA
ncbi:unnamed protein product [Clonostachys rosea]|uniref:Amidase domain-containing protein n=1 Tax=Bionectria ochroleuca TaxID=29856 RepID=A0ABY6TZL2_BIOOC|nr:unnamed protein product [Clonostachys rosea]